MCWEWEQSSADYFKLYFVHFQDYHLVITGHSLGAGTATIVALLLRDRYPNMKCYAYSPAASLK